MEDCHVCINSSWKRQGPYDISVCVQNLFEGEELRAQDNELGHIQRLVTLESDSSPSEPCFLKLSCKPGIEITSIEVRSSARFVELHDDVDGYLRTAKGEKISVDGDVDLYKKEISLDRPQTKISLKFVSMTDKHRLHLHKICSSLRKAEGFCQPTTRFPGQQNNIDMDRVRDLLSSQQPLTPQAENLMESIEQYQRNQSSVMQDLQNVVAESSVSSPSANSRDPVGVMGKMASLLSNIPRLQQSAQAFPNPEAMSKMMSSLGGSGDSAGSESIYSTLQFMCKDVSKMRSAEKRPAIQKKNDRSKEDSESNLSNSTIEEQLRSLIHNMEESIVCRLEARLKSIEAHIDLRLNRIETMLADFLLSQKTNLQKVDSTQDTNPSNHITDNNLDEFERNLSNDSIEGNSSKLKHGENSETSKSDERKEQDLPEKEVNRDIELEVANGMHDITLD